MSAAPRVGLDYHTDLDTLTRLGQHLYYSYMQASGRRRRDLGTAFDVHHALMRELYIHGRIAVHNSECPEERDA